MSAAPRAVPAGPAPPASLPPGTSSLRIVSTLASFGALAGLVIVLVHQWAQPRIDAHQARVLSDAVFEVLAGPARYQTLWLVDGAFAPTPPAGADSARLERVYLGWDERGRPVGVAVAGAEAGFQDVIRLLFGYHPGRGEVLGMKVLESKETPGLGDKIEKDSSFLREFGGVAAPLLGVTPSRARGEPGEVDMITGATISSRAVIGIVNHRLEQLSAPLAELWAAAESGALAPPGVVAAGGVGTNAAPGGVR